MRDPHDPYVDRSSEPTVEGLPTTGAMGTQPSTTVSNIMAIVSFIVLVVASQLGYSVPPEVQEFADDWGLEAAALAVAAWQFAQGKIIKGRVFAPASVATRYLRKGGLAAAIR